MRVMNVYPDDVIQAERKQTKKLSKVGYERYISPCTPMNNNKHLEKYWLKLVLRNFADS